MNGANFVQWNLEPRGYRVVVYDAECQPVDDYFAGDNPHDSGAIARPGYPRVKRQMLRKWAKQTAIEMAASYGLPVARVSHDADSEMESAR